MPPTFGLSTRIVHDTALDAQHVALFARHGLTTLELAATRTHVDYSSADALRNLGRWLADAGAALHAVRAPRADGVRGRSWVAPFSLSSDDAAERRKALDEARLALEIRQTLPFDILNVHLERPRAAEGAAPESAASARRSLEDLLPAADEAGVRVALVSGSGPLSSPESLVRLIERDFDDSDIGICLGFQAHARDIADAIEECSEHLIAATIPASGGIHWESAMMGAQKVGYDGALLFDVDATDGLDAALQRVVQRRERLREMLTPF